MQKKYGSTIDTLEHSWKSSSMTKQISRHERMAREQALRVWQQQEQDAIDQRKLSDAQFQIKHAISVRDGLRDLAVMKSCFEVELHRMADRVDAIAKQIGLQAITLKAAGIAPAAAPAREADLSDAIAITKAAAAVIKIPAAAIEASESLRADVLAHRSSIIMPHEATEDCQHAGCIYLATHGKYCTLHQNDDITVINDSDLPEQFRYENAYPTSDEKVAAFKAYCTANSIFYYARPRESFFKHEAFELARAAGCTKLLMEDLS